MRLIPVAAPRGMIYDRHGVVMARSSPSFVVALDSIGSARRSHASSQRSRRSSALTKLPCGIGCSITAASITPISRQVAANEPYGPVVLATGLPVPTVARLSEVLADLPGVDLEVQPMRDYPQGPLALASRSVTSARSRKTSTSG